MAIVSLALEIRTQHDVKRTLHFNALKSDVIVVNCFMQVAAKIMIRVMEQAQPQEQNIFCIIVEF